MAFLGANTDELRQQAQLCSTDAGKIEELLGTLASAVDGVEWVGPDADSFRDRFHGEVEAAVRQAIEDLRQRGTDLTQQAEDQDRTSDDAGGGSGATGGSGSGGGVTLGGGQGGGANGGNPTGPKSVEQWLSGSQAGGQKPYMYGTDGYGPGQAATDDRPVGPDHAEKTFEQKGSVGPFDVDASGQARASIGAQTTTDAYGNHTATAGARAGAEGSAEVSYQDGHGQTFTLGAKAGAEGYEEAGGTIGFDGASAGARIGANVYGEETASVTDASGASASVGVDGSAGASANANAFAHVTRTESGQLNGFTLGAQAAADAGAQGNASFKFTSPGGWFSMGGSAGASYGFHAGTSEGVTISTDSVDVKVGAKLGAVLGLKGDATIQVSPNKIVNSFTPGDRDLDDVISTSAGWAKKHWPF